MKRWNHGLTKVFHYLGRNTEFKFWCCVKINLVCTPRRSHIWGLKLIHCVSFHKCLQKMKFQSLWKLQAEESGVKLLVLKMSSHSQVRLRKISQKVGSVGVTFSLGCVLRRNRQRPACHSQFGWNRIGNELLLTLLHMSLSLAVLQSLCGPHGLRVGVRSKGSRGDRHCGIEALEALKTWAQGVWGAGMVWGAVFFTRSPQLHPQSRAPEPGEPKETSPILLGCLPVAQPCWRGYPAR